jgi:prepilin-type N-terminal cleavage/methylation domain-containing protein
MAIDRLRVEQGRKAFARRSRRGKSAFTLVEIMVVVAIVGILATLALASMLKVRQQTQDVQFMNDLRQVTSAFEQYALEKGTYPPDQMPAILPPGVAAYMPRMNWSAKTPIGGKWDWDLGGFGVTAGVSVYQPDRTDAEMTDIDARIDDGNLQTGIFRKRLDGYIYIIQF